ncbi:uncharacterized protein EAF02_011611 [Botrytis sinoallii]|uniref:uncharacterized protein n=1 Tax=Botrytis sinoallii TaxID=1463999 RepID=UPI001902B20D|nr:uncharacterized protein EAF02_011611 [Botrytis sinoallii]KAF7854436.1 hypothetical protein EAF02_011611 [Botrytis sinoallii]
MSRLSKYMTSYFRKTPQAPQSPRQSIELDIVDTNGRPLISPKANEILDEIENGMICPICIDTLAADISEIWSYHCCYHVFHPRCIRGWVITSTRSPNSVKWRCPGCNTTERRGRPLPSCWCKKHSSKTIEINAGSCGQSCSRKRRCGTRRNCPTYICSAICHPGPCFEPTCTDNCGEEIPQEPDDQQQLADSIADFQKNLWYLIPIFIFNFLAILWTVNRIRRFTTPLENQKFTEGEFRKHEQNICFVAAAVLFVLNSIMWGSNLHSINKCLRIYLGLSTSIRVPTSYSISWRRTKIIAARVVLTILWIIFIILVFCIPAVGTCDSFDTRIKLSEPSVDYFGLHSRTTKEGRIHINHLYTQTPGLYPYPSWKDYESYKSGVNLFNITRINNTALNNPTLPTSKPFDKSWRIMGIYGDKPMHLDFDLLHRSWRMKEGIIVIDSEDPSSSFYKGGVLFDRLKPGEIYDSNKTSHLVPNFGIAIQNLHEVRNGTWTATDAENMELEFPELDLHIPMWGLFEKHCVYQSFMRVFRRPTDESRKTWNTWSKESNGEEVMRTASFGYGGNKGLQVCVKRRNYTWSTSAGVQVTEPGLGEDLLVPLGLMAVVRRSMRMEQGKMRDNCRWPED